MHSQLYLVTLLISWFGSFQCNVLPPIGLKQHYKVASLVYDGFALTDLIGPTDVIGLSIFNFSQVVIGKKANCKVQSAVKGFYLETQMSVDHAANLDEKDKFDMVVVPGGGLTSLEELMDKKFVKQLTKLLQRADIVLSVCTGSVILAQTKELDYKQATSNKMFFKNFTKPYDKVNWVYKARWVHDQGGKYITASGLSAGYDAALYLVSRIYGIEQAKLAARALEFNATWDPADDPFAVDQ